MNYCPPPEPTSSSFILSRAEPAVELSLRLKRSHLGWLSVLLMSCLVLSGCSTNRTNAAESKNSSVVTNTSTSSAPKEPNDQNVRATLDSLLDSSPYSTARWGMEVQTLDDGRVIYQRNSQQLFTPASNMKVFTTAVGLELLGADYHWRTSVYSDVEPDSSGVVRGDLILYGRGAPDLTSTNRPDGQNSLEALVNSLVVRGVRRITGNVVGDESYFRGDSIGEGWQWNDLQWYFGAEASALSIDGNATEISISQPPGPGEKPEVTTSDETGFIHLHNNVASVERGAKYRLGIQRGLSDNEVTVWGDMPPAVPGYGANLSVHHPAAWASHLFLRALKARGISIDGAVVTRDWHTPVGQRFDPTNKPELAFVTGRSLGEIVKLTNKHSVNLYAELILRTLGRERGTMLGADETPGRERGDDEAGAELVRLWLARSGIQTEGLAIHDGSGLSRLDLVSPHSLVQLLRAIARGGNREAFRDSLPIADTDGTLTGRLPGLKGKVAAKTGTLTYDHSLAGYLTLDSGKVLVFSVTCNDFLGKNGGSQLIDQLVASLAKASSQNSALAK